MSSMYTKILSIGTAALVGATLASFQNRRQQKSKTQTRINDHHVHMMSPNLWNIMNERWQKRQPPLRLEPNLNASQLIQYMDECNVEKALVVSSAYLYTSDAMQHLYADNSNLNEQQKRNEKQLVAAENEYIYAQCQQYPTRLMSSFSIHPLKEYSAVHANRCLSKPNNKVCKLHFSNSNVNLRENADAITRIKRIFQLVEQHNGCILLHFDNCFMHDDELGDIQEYVAHFMKQCILPFPNLTVIFAHLGGFGGFDKRTADILQAMVDETIAMKITDRIYFDISSVFFTEKPMDIVPAYEEKERLEQIVERMREHNMLKQLVYGSDYPFVNAEQYAKNTKQLSPFTDSELLRIFENDDLFT